jgi:hypothetical protein
LEAKDFFHQLGKCLAGSMSSAILPQKALREPVFEAFTSFIRYEYEILFQRKSLAKFESQGGANGRYIEKMTQANIMDSESMRTYRRTSYACLSSYLDLLRRADSLKQVPQIGDFQELMKSLLSSTDNKLQKCALECLTKSGYCRGMLTKYKKTLEGFADEEKFKDMIPIMAHGSHTGPGAGESVPEEYTKDSQDKQAKKAKRKETKSTIPKLEEEDRASVLPVVIKLLQSKLQQQKGAINKKSIHARRNLVFQFYATFDKQTEFPLIVNELLSGIGLTLESCGEDSLLDSLSGVNFNDFVTFIKQLDAMLKQMGTLLFGLLPSLANVLVNGLIKLSKLFVQQVNDIKLQNGEAELEEEEDGADGEDSDEEDEAAGEVVHRNAGRQAKDCLRKALGLVKDIFRKFSYDREFISGFSEMVFREVMCDQLPLLKTKYICDKSQLLEVICIAWTEHHHTLENLIRYAEVIPAAVDMLSH